MVDLEKIRNKTEPSEESLPCGSVALLAIIVAIILIAAVFPLSRNWIIGLTIVLVILGLVVVFATVSGWQDWRLFRDTAIEATGTVVQRTHKQHKDSYGDLTHEYLLVVEFMNDRTSVRLKETINETRYNTTPQGTSLVVRFVPSRPELAIFQWDPDQPSA